MSPSSAPRLESDLQRYAALLEMVDVVSRRRDPAEALLESEELLATYFNASRVGCCILDTDFRYLAINHTLAEMNGFPAEAHLGKSLREILGTPGDQLQHVEVSRPDVHMRVDQPRHQGPTADVDHIALGRPFYATLRDLLDEPVGDQHLGATPQFHRRGNTTAINPIGFGSNWCGATGIVKLSADRPR